MKASWMNVHEAFFLPYLINSPDADRPAGLGESNLSY